jgi:NAD(P)-dependent dehydrogenase (short-subunit alcohol dehydrogenase family)
MAGKLAGRVGIITGAASGMGRAGSLLFAREGAAIVAVDVNELGGAETVASVEQEGGRALFVRADVSRSAEVQGAVRAAVERFGKLNLIWSNAGIPLSKSIVETTEDEWDRIVGVNLTASFLLAKHGIPELLRAGGGTIVVTASTLGFVAAANWSAYAATKGGVVQLCRSIAVEYAGKNIRANCVCPSSTDTPMQEFDMRTRGIPYEDAVREDTAAQPMGRFGRPEEIARAALFLSCDDSSFMTGSTLFADGGNLAQ